MKHAGRKAQLQKQCMNCGSRGMVHATRLLPFEYRGARLRVKAAGWFCPSCKEAELDDMAAYSRKVDEFVGQVEASERELLGRVRRKLKLTQHEAAAIAGGGPNAFSRYERGKAKPVAGVVNLFRLLDRRPELLKEIRPPSS